MSLIFMDGFESEGSSANNGIQYNETANNAVNSIQSSVKRSGTYAKLCSAFNIMQQISNTQWARTTISWNKSSSYKIIIGFGMRLESSSQDQGSKFTFPSYSLMRFGIWGGTEFRFRFNNSYQLEVYSTTTSSTLATSSYQMYGSTWYYYQFGMYCHSTLGQLKVKMGNETVINLTNINTSMPGNCPNYFQQNAQMAITSYTTNIYIDDLYVLSGDGTTNNDFLGICSVYGNRPSADGDATDFNASTGNRQDCIDEHSTNLGDYVYTDSTNKKCLFEFTDNTIDATILCLRVQSWVARSDSGSGHTKYKQVYRDKYDNEYIGAEELISASTFYINHRYHDINPISLLPQTNSDIAEMQQGAITTRIE